MPLVSNVGKRKQVMLDDYFNHESKAGPFGDTIIYHYKWGEKDNDGFSFLSHIFNMYGAATSLMVGPPTEANLKNAAVYFLVDPDFPKENKSPHYIEANHINTIYNYVNNGGVLVMMANDSNNVEFKNFNKLAERFGIHWNENMRHDVINHNYEQGALPIPANHPIFKTAKKVYIKQLCTQTIENPAISVYTENDEILMSMAMVGKGTVFAVGDPWFYNEYLDGRKLPAGFDNYVAAEDLVKWLLDQSKN
jgi:unsaturated rhamnogalacturonyl hydrolase